MPIGWVTQSLMLTYHRMYVDFGLPSQDNYTVTLTPIKILNHDTFATELDKEQNIPNDHLPYSFTITAKGQYSHYSYKYFSPFIGITIKVRSKNIEFLVGGFYMPTTIFAFLSMISFFIHSDMVRSNIICRH